MQYIRTVIEILIHLKDTSTLDANPKVTRVKHISLLPRSLLNSLNGLHRHACYRKNIMYISGVFVF